MPNFGSFSFSVLVRSISGPSGNDFGIIDWFLGGRDDRHQQIQPPAQTQLHPIIIYNIANDDGNSRVVLSYVRRLDLIFRLSSSLDLIRSASLKRTAAASSRSGARPAAAVAAAAARQRNDAENSHEAV